MKIRKAENYEEAMELLKGWFRPGVFTNNFLTAEDYRREIQKGTLYYGLWPEGLLFLRKREGFFRAAYHFFPGELCPQLPRGMRVIMEIPARPQDVKAPVAEAFWEAEGFVPVLERLRYRQKAGGENSQKDFLERGTIVLAGNSQVSEVLSFLNRQFDPLTGCLPTLEELSRDTVFCLLDEKNTLAGVLHGFFGRAFSEIRHLALREDFRGKGYGKALVYAYEKRADSPKRLVWTGAENLAARRLYEKCGYSPDGWTARVLEYGKEEWK